MKKNRDRKLVLVEWEDIIEHHRVPLPTDNEGIDDLTLTMETVGYLREYENHIIVISDFDVTNDGKEYYHNTFSLIPKGVIHKITYLVSDGTPLEVPAYKEPCGDGRTATNRTHPTHGIETKKH